MKRQQKPRISAIAPIGLAAFALALVASREIGSPGDSAQMEGVVARPARAGASKADNQSAPAPERAPASAPSIPPVNGGSSGRPPNLEKAKDLSGYKKQIAAINECYSKTCDYPSGYPREYSNSIGQSLKATLFELTNFVELNRVRGDEVGRGGARSTRQFGRAREERRRSAFSRRRSHRPPTRDAILSGVVGDHDETLVPQALLELRRYDLDRSPEIHDALIESMEHGAPYVAVTIAEQIEPFINDSTYAHYRSALAQLSPGTESVRRLAVGA